MRSRVLVVEDSPTQAERLCTLLEAEGYAVIHSRTGEEALEQLGQQAFDIVLSDVMMPGIDGYELCRRIKERSDVPVVLLTTLGDPMDIVRGLEAGGDNYITKPYAPEHLLARIRRVLDNRHLRYGQRTTMGVKIAFLGSEFTITSEREQILDLLLSSVEDIVQTNRALEERQRQLTLAHAQLETSARESAREARVSSERARVLMQNAKDGIFLLDANGVVLELNESAAGILGRAAEEVLYRPLEQFVAGNDASRFVKTLREQQGTTRNPELRDRVLLRPDGTEVCLELSGSPTVLGDEEFLMVVARDVTQRRRAEVELRQRESQLAEAQELAHVGSWSLDLQENLAVWSDEGYRIFGLDPAVGEFTFEQFLDMVAAEHREQVVRASEACIREGREISEEFWIVRASDGPRFVHARGAVELGRDGVPLRLRGTVQDITERKRAEEAIRESNERFRQLAENIPQVFWISAHGTNELLYVSPSFERLWGIPTETLYSDRQSWRDAVHPDDCDRVYAVMAERTSEPYEVEYRIMKPDGEIRWINDRGFPVRDERGEVVRIARVAEDVTVYVEAEQALQRSEEFWRSLVEHSADLIVVLGADGKIFYAGPEVSRNLGYTADEIVGTDPLSLVHPEDLESVQESLREARENPGILIRTEFRCRHKSGDWRALVSRSRNLLEHESVAGIVVNSRDVTEQRRTEEQFRQAQKMEAVGRLAGGIAHDFNNLLTSIRGFAQIALDELDPDHPVREHLAEVTKSSERAAALTQQLLAFSRRQVLRRQVIDPHRVIEDSGKMLARLVGQDISLDLRLAENAGHVLADPGQLQQVIVNLVINARDALPHGGEIVVETRKTHVDESEGRELELKPGPYLELSVRDNGVGIPEELQEQVFEPFFTTKEPGKGTGLGLSTVYGILQQSEGTVRIESEVGAGTVVTLYLPAVDEDPSKVDAIPAPAQQTSGGGETILVVEDDPTVQKFARRVLERQGYGVVAAATGAEALELLRSADLSIHAVVTDVVMPGMTGFELATRIAQIRPGVPVIFTSGYARDDLPLTQGLAGESHFLEKPYAPADLTRAVHEALTSA